MSLAGNWADLRDRVLSAIAMIAVGAVALWAGGVIWHVLLAVLVGLMIWELARMQSPDQPEAARTLAMLFGAALLLASYLSGAFALPVLLAPAMVALSQLKTGRSTFMIYGSVIMLAGYALIDLRDSHGAIWELWLVVVVITSDVMGYFAGRLIGGPKFWPAVSPKKTWSGTIAGWAGALLVGSVFIALTNSGPGLIALSVAVAMAAQMGDIAESAIKRRAGVKDSSNLIPGHGGLLDRFDGMIGAALLLLVIRAIATFPPGL